MTAKGQPEPVDRSTADRGPMNMLRVSEVAQRLAISRSKCYELINRRVLPSIRVGGAVRIPGAALDRWVVAQLEAVWKADLT